MKKILALAVSAVMVGSLVSLPTFAEANTSEGITTEVNIYYKRTNDDYELSTADSKTGWNLWCWGDKELSPGYFDSTVSEHGVKVTFVLDKAISADKGIGYIIRYSDETNDWSDRETNSDNPEDGNRDITAAKVYGEKEPVSGTVNVYNVQGSQTWEVEFIPGDVEDTTPRIDVEEDITFTVTYKREDGKYDGWNLYYFVEGGTGNTGSSQFTVKDGVASATITVNAKGGESVGFIARYSTADNEWALQEDTVKVLPADVKGTTITVPEIKGVKVVENSEGGEGQVNKPEDNKPEDKPQDNKPQDNKPGDTSKPNSNTGAEGVAVAAGLAVVATAAAIVAKKRK